MVEVPLGVLFSYTNDSVPKRSKANTTKVTTYPENCDSAKDNIIYFGYLNSPYLHLISDKNEFSQKAALPNSSSIQPFHFPEVFHLQQSVSHSRVMFIQKSAQHNLARQIAEPANQRQRTDGYV